MRSNNTPSPSPKSQLPRLQDRLLRQRFHDELGRRTGIGLDVETSNVDRPPHRPHPATEINPRVIISTAIPVASLVSEQAPSPWSESSSNGSTLSPRDSGPDPKRKRPRFLGDIDRRMIIQRLQNGEKQADLAREFGVTRAAICHINKNRNEILTRFDILAKSPQGRQMIENYVRSPHFSSTVRELRTPSVSVLLTRLNDANHFSSAFKPTADRLMTILLEEALVCFGTKPVGVEELLGSTYEGKDYAKPTFALSIGNEGRPLLQTFATMEPMLFRGLIHVEVEGESREPAVTHIDLPKESSDFNVLVLTVTMPDMTRIRCVLEAFQERGFALSRICFVCITASADSVTAMTNQYRDTKLVTAIVNGDNEAPRVNRFVERYTEASRS